jgi:hypothetical protein
MHGAVAVQSVAGEGSNFTVTLPVADRFPHPIHLLAQHSCGCLE